MAHQLVQAEQDAARFDEAVAEENQHVEAPVDRDEPEKQPVVGSQVERLHHSAKIAQQEIGGAA